MEDKELLNPENWGAKAVKKEDLGKRFDEIEGEPLEITSVVYDKEKAKYTVTINSNG